MGFILFTLIKKLLKLLIKVTIYFAIFAALIVLIPNLPPYSKFSSIELAPTKPRDGALAPNDLLNNAEQLYKGKLLGPEAFQLLNGELYTSLATGEIVKVSPGGHVTFVTKIGMPCTGLTQEHICGRPLGFQIDESGKFIYVVDTYHGIWKVDLKTDKKQLLVSPRAEIEKRQPKLFNSIALHKNGDFYWTDSSSEYELKDGTLTSFTDPTGRLFHYNAAKNESKVLLDNLWFSNGVVLSPDNQFLVMSESYKYRLLKHYIAGPNKGKTEVFVDGLPGLPDNLRPLPDGSGLLAGLYVAFDDQDPMLARSLAPAPIARKFLARLHTLIETPFEYLNTVYPHHLLEEIVYNMGHFKTASAFTPKQCGLLHLDWNGDILGTYYNNDGSLRHISDGIVYNDKLYLGSPHVQDFIGAVPVPPALKKAFTAKKIDSVPKETKKVETKPVAVPKKEEPKVAKPVAPKPKVEEKKVEPKPKVEEKKVEPKPKVEEKKVEPKPKVETKPKVEEKREAPKVAKPVANEAKPDAPARVAEPAKPTPKPVEAKPTTTLPPKAVPKAAPKAEPSKVTPTTTEKATQPPPKKIEKAPTTPPPKTTQAPKAAPTETKKQEAKPSKPVNAKADEKLIPIKEDIPSDTAKPPSKEPLRVIKKGGPTEIPAPKQ